MGDEVYKLGNPEKHREPVDKSLLVVFKIESNHTGSPCTEVIVH